ncbi:unnamed protein product [Caenorhabditis nigoni]
MDDDAIKQIAVCRMCLRSKHLPAAAQNRFAQNSSNAKIVRTSRAHIFQVDKSAHQNVEKDARIKPIRRLREEESREIVKLVQFLPHYGQLNPRPSLWQILFDNQDASQNDADDLIIRTEDEDDGHLLTQDLVEATSAKRSPAK